MAERASFRDGMTFAALSFGTLALLGIGSSVAVARIYGIEAVGAYALALAPSGALAMLSTVREQVGLVRELSLLEARAPRVTGLFAAVFAFSLALTIVVAAIVTAVSYLLLTGPIDRPDLFAPALALVAGFVVLMNTCWNLDMVLSAFRCGRELFWIRLLQALAFLVFAVVAAQAFPGVWGLTLATLGSFLIGLLHRLLCVRAFMRWTVSRSELREGFRTLPELIRMGLKIAPGSVVSGISMEAATWVLAALVPVAALGAYNRAWMLGKRFIDLSWQLTEMVFPTLTRRRAEGDHEGFDRALVDSIRYSVTVMLLPAAVGGGAAYGVMSVFGPGFSQGAGALPFILVLPAISIVAAMLGTALFSVDRLVTSTLITIVGKLVVIGLTFVLPLWLGITGAAVALVVGYTLETVWMAWVVRPYLTRSLAELWPPREVLAVVLASSAGFAVARAVDSSLPGVAGLAAALTSGSVTYAAAFLATGGLNPRDWERLASLRAGFRRRRFPGTSRPSESRRPERARS